MRAVGFTEFGGPEVMGVVELPDPEPGPGEVRVRVHAAAINPTDTGLRSGVRRPERLARHRPPYIAGMDLAGVVDAVGEGADREVGDEVLAIAVPAWPTGGAQAERVVVPVESTAAIPEGIGMIEAATLPMNGLTARRALDLAGLRPGEVLLVTGAAGTLGGYLIQLAVAEGLEVVADTSPADEPLVRGAGAHAIVPRGDDVAQHVLERYPDGVDAVVDAAVIGAPVLAAVRDGGTCVCVRDFEGRTERGIGVHRVSVTEVAKARGALEELARLAAVGVLTLRVADTLPPERIVEAHRRLEAGGVRGRLVIRF